MIKNLALPYKLKNKKDDMGSDFSQMNSDYLSKGKLVSNDTFSRSVQTGDFDGTPKDLGLMEMTPRTFDHMKKNKMHVSKRNVLNIELSTLNTPKAIGNLSLRNILKDKGRLRVENSASFKIMNQPFKNPQGEVPFNPVSFSPCLSIGEDLASAYSSEQTRLYEIGWPKSNRTIASVGCRSKNTTSKVTV